MFKILNYINKLEVIKETETHLTCVCPICGDDNFKIKKTGKYKGAYKCWSNECSSEQIREKLGFTSIYNYSQPKRPIIRVTPKETSFTGTSLALVKDYSPIQPKIKKFSGGAVAQERIYPYSADQRVLRIDNVTSGNKFIYIQYENDSFDWVSGAGDKSWPVYTRGLEEILKNPNYDTLLFVEGEKTAEFCKENGVAALTLMSSCFHGSELDKTLMLFFLRHPHITNVVFVPDEDKPGFKKAENFQISCWRHSVGCKVIKMSEIVASPDEGMDLADLSQEEFKKIWQQKEVLSQKS